MWNKIFWIIIVILVIWGIVVLVNPKEDVSKETWPITIGFISPLTGEAASYGEVAKNAVGLAVENINKDGGINGREIKVIYEDGGCDGSMSASAAQKLLNVDKVKIILGGFCSGESLAAVPVVNSANGFLVSGGSSSPALTNISKNFARTYPSDSAQSIVLANAAYNINNWRKIAIIQEQTDYAVALRESFVEEFTNFGGEVVLEQFSTQTQDFRTTLTKLKAENTDALFVDVQTASAAERVLSQLVDLNWSPKLIMNDVIGVDPVIVSKNAEVMEGAITTRFSIKDNSVIEELRTQYRNKFNVEEIPLEVYFSTIYDSAVVVASGIEEVGEDPDRLGEWFRGLEGFSGASGEIKINEFGDREGGMELLTIKNGELIPIE